MLYALAIFLHKQISLNTLVQKGGELNGKCRILEQCRFCTGTGSVTVEIGSGETEVSRCINCEGAGTLTCTTCQGTGIQPRYLDRR